MNYQQSRNVFPTYEKFNYAGLLSYRLHAIAKIPSDHKVVLAKMAEICGDEWPLPLLQWMYLINDNRGKTIKEYQELIRQADAGEIEIGTREEALREE